MGASASEELIHLRITLAARGRSEAAISVASIYGSDETVSGPRHGFDVASTALRSIKDAAQSRDVHRDDPFGDEAFRPDELQKLTLGDQFAGAADKGKQKLMGFGSES